MNTHSVLNSSGIIPLFVIGIAAAVLFSLSGVLIFADSAKPGDVLYAVDRGIEKVQISLTTEKTAKAKLESSLALERANELNQAVKSKDTKKVIQATKEHEQQLKDTLAKTETIEVENLSLKETNEIVDNIEKQKAIIDELLSNVQGEEKESLQNAKNNADIALIATYEQLKNRTTETKKEQGINLLTSTSNANIKPVQLQAFPSCSNGHDGYGEHLDLTIKADMQTTTNSDIVLAIIDQQTKNTAYFAVMKNGFSITEIKAHDDLGSLRGPLFRLKLETDGREYKIQALKVANSDKYDPNEWSKNSIGETSFAKKCSKDIKEEKPEPLAIETASSENTASQNELSTNSGKASLSLSPQSRTLNRGCTYDIAVELDTNGLKTSGADVVLLYDPKVLSISTSNVKTGKIYNEYLPNTWQTKPGEIEFSGLSNISSWFEGKGIFASYSFKVLETAALGETVIKFEFDPNDPYETTDSNVVQYAEPGSGIGKEFDSKEMELLTSVINGNYTIGSGNCN